MSIVMAVTLIAALAAVFMMDDQPKRNDNYGGNRPNNMAAGNNGPTATLNASHILILHQDSAKAPLGMKRTHQEALQLANKVRDLARAENANFAAIAKAYSEGPSASRGGDLGNFSPSSMAPRFSQATEKLNVGEVSEPVETKFGFHIILRKDLQ